VIFSVTSAASRGGIHEGTMRTRPSTIFPVMLAIAGRISASLHGQILDARSRVPLDSVKVTIASSGAVVWSDAQGMFDLGTTGVSRRSVLPSQISIRRNILMIPSGITAQIFDLRGRMILQGREGLDLTRLATGIYRGKAGLESFKLIQSGRSLSILSSQLMTDNVMSSAGRSMAVVDTLRFKHRGYPTLVVVTAATDTAMAIKLTWSAEQEFFDSATTVLERGLLPVIHDTLAMDTASALFKAYLAKWPHGLEPDNARRQIGYIDFLQGRFASGAVWFSSVLDSFPNSVYRTDATYYLGRCKYDLGLADATQYPLARALFETVVSMWPASVHADNASYYIGRCWHQVKSYDSAIAAYRKSEKLYPTGDLVDAGLYYTGVAFYDLKRYDTTLAVEASLPIRFPASLYRDNALYVHAKALYRKPNLVAAAPEFDAVIAWSPTSNVLDYALYYRSRIWLDQGNCASAKPLIQRLRTEFPTASARTLADSYATKLSCIVP